MKYKKVKKGEPITILYQQAFKKKGASLNFSCCDCGLVHGFFIIPYKTRLKMFVWRDNKRTANHRRLKKFQNIKGSLKL